MIYHRGKYRFGATNPVLLILLTAILVALIVLIVVLTKPSQQVSGGGGGGTSTTGGSGGQEKAAVKADQTAQRADLPNPPPPPKPLRNPDRIKETLQQGKTYVAIVKVGFDARVEDKDWGLKSIVSLAYLAEMEVAREIEKNDGEEVVEVRHFRKSRNAKLLSEVEGVKIDLGKRGELVLDVLDSLTGGTLSETRELAEPMASILFKGVMQYAVDSKNSKAFAHIDSLSGKKVRLKYRDGQGVVAVTPIGCDLTAAERDFVFTTAVASDCYLLPDVTLKAGQSWTVDGAQFSGFLDPNMRGIPRGEVVLVREPDTEQGEKKSATLRIQSGHLEIDNSDSTQSRIGSFTPRGKLQYDLTEGFVSGASLRGDISLEEVSKDHLLFEASFRTRPVLQVSYSCSMR